MALLERSVEIGINVDTKELESALTILTHAQAEITAFADKLIEAGNILKNVNYSFGEEDESGKSV